MLGTLILFTLTAGFVLLFCRNHQVRFEYRCNVFKNFIIARLDCLNRALRKLMGNDLTSGNKHWIFCLIAIPESDLHIMLD